MNTKTTLFKSFSQEIYSNNRSYLRKVLMTTLKRDLKGIRHKEVLEIGCGDWDYAKRILEKNGCKWYGFEPVDLRDKNLTLVKGSVKNIPYHNNSFDYVICNQTIEHWFEYGVSFNKALKEIHRTLKSGGVLMINAPIYLHGHPYFLQGKLRKIRKIFKKSLWNIKLFERCIPPVKEQRWKQIASEGFFSEIGYPDILIPNSKNAYSYLLNINVVKKPDKTKNKNFSYAKIRPLIVIIRFTKEYFLKFLGLR